MFPKTLSRSAAALQFNSRLSSIGNLRSRGSIGLSNAIHASARALHPIHGLRFISEVSRTTSLGLTRASCFAYEPIGGRGLIARPMPLCILAFRRAFHATPRRQSSDLPDGVAFITAPIVFIGAAVMAPFYVLKLSQTPEGRRELAWIVALLLAGTVSWKVYNVCFPVTIKYLRAVHVAALVSLSETQRRIREDSGSKRSAFWGRTIQLSKRKKAVRNAAKEIRAFLAAEDGAVSSKDSPESPLAMGPEEVPGQDRQTTKASRFLAAARATVHSFSAAKDDAACAEDSPSAKSQETLLRGTVRVYRQMVAKPDDRAKLVLQKDEEIARVVVSRTDDLKWGRYNPLIRELIKEDMENSTAGTLKIMA